MRVAAWRYCDRTLTLLLKTFIDIILLRKGPEHVPDSAFVLGFAVALLLAATAASGGLAQAADGDNTLMSLVSSLLGYLLYWIVLALTGFGRRLVPTLAAIMACGSILTLGMIVALIIVTPLLGGAPAATVVWLILIWSVSVKGHIIARAIERHWYTGMAIALSIFILQYVAYLAMTGRGGA